MQKKGEQSVGVAAREAVIVQAGHVLHAGEIGSTPRYWQNYHHHCTRALPIYDNRMHSRMPGKRELQKIIEINIF